jgi:hypothetical protein
VEFKNYNMKWVWCKGYKSFEFVLSYVVLFMSSFPVCSQFRIMKGSLSNYLSLWFPCFLYEVYGQYESCGNCELIVVVVRVIILYFEVSSHHCMQKLMKTTTREIDTHFDVFPANKTILVKFFRVLSRVVWFCFCRHRRFEYHLCLHHQGCWVGVGLVDDPVQYLYL